MSGDEVGFVLVSVMAKREKEVFDEMGKIEEIVDLHPLFGEYDIIAKIKAESHEAIATVVVDKIRSIPGVVDTRTMTRIKM